ncbi:hypothetical protein ACS386_09525 [Flavobacteriaceae bacterium LMO-SS05]
MKVLRQLFDFYINCSIHVALAVVSLSWLTLLEFQVLFDETILYFIFFAAVTGYNFVKYFGLAKFHHRSLARWLKSIQVFSFFCFILMVYYAFKIQIRTLCYIGGLGLVTFLYAIPFLPRRLFMDEKQNLRDVGGIKIYIIALVWTGATVFLPLVNNDIPISDDIILSAIQRFIFVIALMLPFEIRDLQYDSLKLSTIPQKIGEKWTKIMGVVLLVFFYVLEFFKSEVVSKRLVILLLITVIMFLFILFAKKYQGKYYSGFWVEGIPIFWLLLVLFS